MRFFLAADHAGFELKEKIKKYLEDLKHEVKDFGAFEYEEKDDYPDFVTPAITVLAEDLKKGTDSKGIIFGGSGQGEAIVANRFPGIRAIVCDDDNDLEIKVKAWREHNDSNVLSFGARFIKEKSALRAVEMWLKTPFTNEPRHARRLKKIDKINPLKYKD